MITTIFGDIEAKTVGHILPHEHTMSDMTRMLKPTGDPEFYEPLSLSNYGLVRLNPFSVRDNAVFRDENIIIYELKKFKEAGGDMFVNLGTGRSRNPESLRRIAEATGVKICISCGKYLDGTAEDQAMTEQEIYDEIINDLTVGIYGTDMRAGVIGEIGTGDVMTDFQKRSLRAAARAQRDTGAGLQIHASLWTREGLNALDMAIKEGAKAERICIDHVDVKLDEEYILSILKTGASVEFDDFGKEFYCDQRRTNFLLGSFATDVERVKFIKMLCDKGYSKQILLSQDICLKSMFHQFGGWGYDHIITNIVPMMEDFGISSGDIELMTVINPRNLMDK